MSSSECTSWVKTIHLVFNLRFFIFFLSIYPCHLWSLNDRFYTRFLFVSVMFIFQKKKRLLGVSVLHSNNFINIIFRRISTYLYRFPVWSNVNWFLCEGLRAKKKENKTHQQARSSRSRTQTQSQNSPFSIHTKYI